MKVSNFLKNSIIALLPLACSAGVLFGMPSIDKVDAYDSNPLPTTIDLNDNTNSEIRNYYSSLNSLSMDERKGTNLLKNLKPILSNNQKYYDYDNGDSIWKLYEIVDRDWEKSPAKDLNGTGYGTYDSTLNIITKYKYGSNSDKKSNPYLHSLYVNRDAVNPKTAWDAHTGRATETACIEREHIWPKSYGFDNDSIARAGARGDPMHLWPADGYVNGMHSNHPYGYVDTGKTYSDAKNNFTFTEGNLTGKSLNFYSTYTGTVFEPQDSDKGDIARACFYMAARYNDFSGTDSSISVDNPNLLLTNVPSSDAGTSTKTKPYSLGFITDLLKWNKLDPVDEFEIHRNNLLYNNYTNNRNPFIDFPQWADMIWGGRDDSANPETDQISNSEAVECVKIEMTKQPNQISYFVNDYINTEGMVITAYFSDNHTEIVDDFTYSPSGKLKITDTKLEVTYDFKTTSCDISVSEREFPETAEITAALLGLTDEYKDGTNEEYNISWTHVKKYTSGSMRVNFDEGSSFYLPKTTGAAIDKIKITVGPVDYSSSNYAYANFGKTLKGKDLSIKFGAGTDYDITTAGNVFTITNPKNYKFFTIGDGKGAINFASIEISYKIYVPDVIHVSSVALSNTSLDLTIGETGNLVPTILPENASNKEVTWSSSKESVATVDNIGNIQTVSIGDATITVSSVDGAKTATCVVHVKELVVPVKITLSGNYQTEFTVGENFNIDGLVVTLYFSNNTTKVVNPTSITGYDMTKVGSQKVIVSYTEEENTFTAKYSIVVKKADEPIDPDDKKNNVGLIAGIVGGLVAVISAITGISVGTTKKMRKGK